MSRITFEEDPFSRKVMMILLMVQVAAMIIVLGLNTIELYSLALAISFLTFIIFVAILIWLYSRYRNIPIVRKKVNSNDCFSNFRKVFKQRGILSRRQPGKETIFFRLRKVKRMRP
jgi:hypothetical protein